MRGGHRGAGERERRRKGVVEAQLVGPLTIDDNDDKWLDLFLASGILVSDVLLVYLFFEQVLIFYQVLRIFCLGR
jgi:hypothetical protein